MGSCNLERGDEKKINEKQSKREEKGRTKNPFDEILSLCFDLRPLKVNNNVLNMLNMSQFCKGLSKGFI
jgi:hypothetical protein